MGLRAARRSASLAVAMVRNDLIAMSIDEVWQVCQRTNGLIEVATYLVWVSAL